MEMELRKKADQGHVAPDAIVEMTRGIYDESLRKSKSLDGGNFSVIHPADLERLFDLYDEQFFAGACRQALGDAPLRFRLSKRMTQAAGKATRLQHRDRRTRVTSTEYEIAVSTTLLFQTFHDVERPIMMSGIACRDRLEALQRIFEHELVHLIEFLLWQNSSCSARRFQSITHRFFLHTEHTHQLITPRERAFTKFGVKPGSQVAFRVDGRHYVGFVNRITKRATVLVEDNRGARYNDGKRYVKFYVPIGQLQPVGD